jgi:hypothetical protein
MYDDKFVLSISGDGECGKDTAAEFFSRHLNINYIHSTSYAVVDYWWEEIISGKWSSDSIKPECAKNVTIEPLDYKSKEELYEDRRNRRQDWVDYIHYYNNLDSSNIKLYKESIIQGNQILTGIRRRQQFLDCLKIIDYSIWMVRPNNKIDSTSEYGSELCDEILLNDGTVQELEYKIKEICKKITCRFTNELKR